MAPSSSSSSSSEKKKKSKKNKKKGSKKDSKRVSELRVSDKQEVDESGVPIQDKPPKLEGLADSVVSVR